MKQGYKQTEAGLIPDDWECMRIGDSCRFIGGGTPSKSNIDYWKGSIPWISSSDIAENDIFDINISRFISETAVSNSATKLCPKGTLLVVSRVGVGKIAIAPTDLCTSQDFCNLVPLDLDPTFLAYKLLIIMQDKSREAQGTSIKGVTIDDIKQISVVLPSFTEQKAIAKALSDIDGLISSLTKLIEKKKNIKQGAMQALLTGRKRLDGFSGEWISQSLRNLGKAYGGLTGKTKKHFEIENSEYRYVPFMNVMSNTIIDLTFLENVSLENGEIPNNIRYGDLFFNTSSETPEEVGLCSVLLADVKNVYLNSFCFGFRLNNLNEINPLFISYLFRSKIGRNLMFSLAQGATRYNLSKNNFYKLEIIIPEYNEQTAIANILYDIDNEIEILEQKLRKYQNIKKGMMQELLTGRIRLVEGAV